MAVKWITKSSDVPEKHVSNVGNKMETVRSYTPQATWPTSEFHTKWDGRRAPTPIHGLHELKFRLLENAN
jgi:hypothetical protein